MTDHANELRRYSRKIGQPAGDVPSVMLAAADEIERLAAMLEEAESDALEQARLNGMGSEREAALMAKLKAAEKERDDANAAAAGIALQAETLQAERDALRAKITEMEKQEPVGTLHDDGCFVWRETAPHQSNYAGWKMALYALPGAQNVPSEQDGLPDRDPSRPAEQQGLFRKFVIHRTDGSSAPGGKHYGCRYFVLDVDHDKHAGVALAAYANACEATHPELAKDLRDKWGAQPMPSAPIEEVKP